MIVPITGFSGRDVRRSADQIAGFNQQCQVRWADDINSQCVLFTVCLLYTSPSPRDLSTSRMPSSA